MLTVLFVILGALALVGALAWLDRISREDLRERGVSLKDD